MFPSHGPFQHCVNLHQPSLCCLKCTDDPTPQHSPSSNDNQSTQTHYGCTCLKTHLHPFLQLCVTCFRFTMHLHPEQIGLKCPMVYLAWVVMWTSNNCLCKGIPLDAQCCAASVTLYVIAVCNGDGQHGDIFRRSMRCGKQSTVRSSIMSMTAGSEFCSPRW
jgi:hypothetical protein